MDFLIYDKLSMLVATHVVRNHVRVYEQDVDLDETNPSLFEQLTAIVPFDKWTLFEIVYWKKEKPCSRQCAPESEERMKKLLQGFAKQYASELRFFAFDKYTFNIHEISATGGP